MSPDKRTLGAKAGPCSNFASAAKGEHSAAGPYFCSKTVQDEESRPSDAGAAEAQSKRMESGSNLEVHSAAKPENTPKLDTGEVIP